jgi:excisionase family DNA binding protein
MTTNLQSEWLTVEEAAHHLRIKPRTLLLWVRQGKVKGFALSGT